MRHDTYFRLYELPTGNFRAVELREQDEVFYPKAFLSLRKYKTREKAERDIPVGRKAA